MVKSKQLRDRVTQRDLAAGADRLQAFATANGGQRAFGGPGHMGEQAVLASPRAFD